jgi:hypothetical protein
MDLSWINQELANIRNQRNRAHKNFLRCPTESNLNQFLLLREEFSQKNDVLNGQYIASYAEKLKSNPSSFWKFVNEKRSTNGFPKQMTFADRTGSSAGDIAKLFGEYFQEVYVVDDGEDVICDIPKKCSLNSVSINMLDVVKGLSELDQRKSAGPDNIPARFLKEYSSAVSVPLFKLFTLSVSTGKVAQCWKTSFITPIFKSGNRSHVSNYRGVAKLCSIPKLLEKLICDKITPIIVPHLHESQHGFETGKSTVTNLSLYSNFLFDSLKEAVQIDSIYTDFKKAFDCVNHRLLIKKLLQFGIEGDILSWIESYLKGRIQFVKIGGAISNQINVFSSVSQGSHIGPLLFLLFINDLCYGLKHSQFLLYADDLKMFKKINNINDSKLLQIDLEYINNWCKNNKMELNVKKCEFITFSKKLAQNRIETTYNLGNVSLNKIQVVRDLGVLFDSDLNFKKQVDHVISKASMMLGFIKRQSKDFKCPYVTKALYCSLVRSVIEYANIIWYPSTATDINRIESVQKQFLLFALRDLGWDQNWNNFPSYENRLMLLKLQSLKLRRKVSCCLFIADILQERIKVKKLSDLIKIKESAVFTRSHQLLQIHIPFASTGYQQHESLRRCSRLFNHVSKAFIESNGSRKVYRNKLGQDQQYISKLLSFEIY